jgi:PAS domain S-box-containing protein
LPDLICNIPKFVFLNLVTILQQIEALLNNATIGITITEKHGKIININKYAESQFGYLKEEVADKTVDILVPLRIDALYHRYREGFYKHPEPRKMGEGRDLYAQIKVGGRIPCRNKP